MTLGECVETVCAPRKIDKKQYQAKGLYPIVDQGQKYIIAYTDNDEALVPKGEYVIFGDHTREIKYVNFAFAQGADGIKILKPKEGILTKYLYHSMLCLKIPNRGYNRHWTVAAPLEIPVPPIAEQERIVGILDRFETLANDIAQGLPAEIDARRQQYEYYRDKLLSFKAIG